MTLATCWSLQINHVLLYNLEMVLQQYSTPNAHKMCLSDYIDALHNIITKYFHTNYIYIRYRLGILAAWHITKINLMYSHNWQKNIRRSNCITSYHHGYLHVVILNNYILPWTSVVTWRNCRMVLNLMLNFNSLKGFPNLPFGQDIY